MPTPPATDEHSRVMGGLVCLAALLAAALFLAGLVAQSYWAIAVPVAALTLFVLGLVFWVGWTIATVHVEAEGEPLGTGGAGGATVSEPEATADPPSGTA